MSALTEALKPAAVQHDTLISFHERFGHLALDTVERIARNPDSIAVEWLGCTTIKACMPLSFRRLHTLLVAIPKLIELHPLQAETSVFDCLAETTTPAKLLIRRDSRLAWRHGSLNHVDARGQLLNSVEESDRGWLDLTYLLDYHRSFREREMLPPALALPVCRGHRLGS